MNEYNHFECTETDFDTIAYLLHKKGNIIFTLSIKDSLTSMVINLSTNYLQLPIAFGFHGGKIPHNSVLCGVLYKSFYAFPLDEKIYPNYVAEKLRYESECMPEIIELSNLLNRIQFCFKKGFLNFFEGKPKYFKTSVEWMAEGVILSDFFKKLIKEAQNK